MSTTLDCIICKQNRYDAVNKAFRCPLRLLIGLRFFCTIRYGGICLGLLETKCNIDAAHRIHPLAGQGVNLGFGDITCLNRVLGDIVHSGSKLDDFSYLKEYETERQRHNIPTMLAVEGLHRLYNSAFTPLVLLRSVGLQLTHALSPVKKAIINQAAT